MTFQGGLYRVWLTLTEGADHCLWDEECGCPDEQACEIDNTIDAYIVVSAKDPFAAPIEALRALVRQRRIPCNVSAYEASVWQMGSLL